MLIVTLIILGLTIVVWLIEKISKIKVCPICAAVVITWASMLILMLSGYNIDKTILAILLSMSIGSLATKYNFGLMWKTGMVVLGLPAGWYLVNDKFSYTIGLFIGMILLTLLFRLKLNNKRGMQQTDRFKECC